jgi:hypothetical protein
LRALNRTGSDGVQAEGREFVNGAEEHDRLAARGLDVTVPNVARIYDFILGGKDHFDADRAAAEQILAVIPGGSGPARMNRAFLGRVVRFLAVERGIRQFLDIGSGLPTAANVHEIAQAVAPDARVVYVDNDPVVVLHAQAILEDRAKGVAAVRGDLRDPAGILASPAVRELIDFSQPVAVLLFAVLHFVPDADDPRSLLARFKDVMAPGSALALSHITDENLDEEASQAGRAAYQSTSAPIGPRSRAQIEGFFDGLDLLPPGVVGLSHWPEPDPDDAVLLFYGGLAVKPAPLPVLPQAVGRRRITLARLRAAMAARPGMCWAERQGTGNWSPLRPCGVCRSGAGPVTAEQARPAGCAAVGGGAKAPIWPLTAG